MKHLLAVCTVLTYLIIDAPLAQAQVDALVVDTSGDVGMGTAMPQAQLHVLDETDARIFVENTSAAVAARTLFSLANAGNTKFSISNTDVGVDWAFTNPGNGFRISRQGSGALEFELTNAGNLNIAGTLTQNSDQAAKQNITPVDSLNILNKVIALPINEWEYKDTPEQRHIGPMAQDFYASFGLGAGKKSIAAVDTDGVALAAIQALATENQQLKSTHRALLTEFHKLSEELAVVKAQLTANQAVEVRLAALEKILRQQPEATVSLTTLK